MSKELKRYLSLFFIITLTSCSYKPIFSEKNYNFEINEILFTGDKYVNKIIESKFNLIKEEQSKNKKKYNISIRTNKEKLIVSKDSKGDPLKFDLVVSAYYEISNNGKLLLNKKIQKNSIYNNEIDKFKLEQSEKIILDNLSKKISETIISSIINLDDN
tara:strand:+ start:838 stop:1314 length:477 start_codon:yes stop_codon:yes gene_type:complete